MYFDKICYIHDKFDRFLDFRVNMRKYMSTYHGYEHLKDFSSIDEEHVYSESKKMVENCKIFQFEKSGPVTDYMPELANNLRDFFLPFYYTAIERDNSCIIFSDSKKGQVGYDHPRFYLGLFDLETTSVFGQLYIAAIGLVRAITIEKETSIDITEESLFCPYTLKQGVYLPETPSDYIHYNQLVDALRHDLMMAFVELAYVNIPTNFILETSQVKVKKNKQKKILRSHQRPSYTLLSPGKIRKILGVSNTVTTGSKKTPHDRRKHDRYLSDKIYSDHGKIEAKIIPSGPRKGQTYYKKLIVPATWIGPSEKVAGNKKYKVILDR